MTGSTGLKCENTYQELREKNIQEKHAVLAELGVTPKIKFQFPGIYPKDEVVKAKSKSPAIKKSGNKYHPYSTPVRRSTRIASRGGGELDQNESLEEIKVFDWDEDVQGRPKIVIEKNRPNVYGVIPGIPVGTTWDSRMECCAAGIHRPTVAGIHAGGEGAYSLVVSGGYEDDNENDQGDIIIYTGEGGRDLKGTKTNPKNLRTAPQSKDQELSRGNEALVKSIETKNPVRVVRGYKLQSPYAPESGYRYDGIYSVTDWWMAPSRTGYKVFKFRLERMDGQPPAPWKTS
ncbi:unnamed protein product [Darwinula stevensoni]|uniref:YDG domain-containing protein n=1 Tax=Darwinula stevensoni TaxID=69355 RepID=A0A7R8XAF7_9CRUS|nr:unnamed protein product [Darwinula stevensoni]CAG0885449.1 unnamed protein product [Darwinula stevensoni]